MIIRNNESRNNAPVSEWDGMGWNGMEWNGMEWNGIEWKRIEWNITVCLSSSPCDKIEYARTRGADPLSRNPCLSEEVPTTRADGPEGICRLGLRFTTFPDYLDIFSCLGEEVNSPEKGLYAPLQS